MSRGTHSEDLPDSERAAWQSLWRDVDELAKRVANNRKADEMAVKPEAAKPLKKDSGK